MVSTDTSQIQPKRDTAWSVKTLVLDCIQIIKDLGPRFYASSLGVLYVAGFLVFNSNLAHFGILDIEFLKARYLIASVSPRRAH